MRSNVLLAGLLLVSELSNTQPVRPPANRPNVILIYTDDLGYGDLSCYGGNISTPNIDRIGKQGIRFTDFYVAAPVCTHSRFSLLTGSYPQRSQHNLITALTPASKNYLDESETTLAQQLGCSFVRVFPDSFPKDQEREATLALMSQGCSTWEITHKAAPSACCSNRTGRFPIVRCWTGLCERLLTRRWACCGTWSTCGPTGANRRKPSTRSGGCSSATSTSKTLSALTANYSACWLARAKPHFRKLSRR